MVYFSIFNQINFEKSLNSEKVMRDLDQTDYLSCLWEKLLQLPQRNHPEIFNSRQDIGIRTW